MPVKAEVFLYALLYFSQNTISLHLVAGEMVVQTPTLSTTKYPENQISWKCVCTCDWARSPSVVEAVSKPEWSLESQGESDIVSDADRNGEPRRKRRKCGPFP